MTNGKQIDRKADEKRSVMRKSSKEGRESSKKRREKEEKRSMGGRRKKKKKRDPRHARRHSVWLSSGLSQDILARGEGAPGKRKE